ncbi:hypothetical protein [Hymenobacter cavernae]|uniref:Lipocalin-like domain-containing protein n=1 Tax=Hymenobacter cavernae TaxID=2044852 RepID=A0ABQ1ULD0_9BACT|nr:hypothetical protein [Hymenobacter cavernae]GGF19912.1 hypothetical protein GCM10011383_34390 [Hymenobacter cavernae]
MNQRSSLIYSLFFLLLTAVLVSCDKDKDVATPKPNILVGRWDLYQTSGGFAGNTMEIAAGTSQLEFTADSTVRFYDKGKLVDTRQYSVRASTSPADGTPAQMIFYIVPGARYSPQHLEVSNDQLILTDDMADGYVHRYRRIK